MLNLQKFMPQTMSKCFAARYIGLHLRVHYGANELNMSMTSSQTSLKGHTEPLIYCTLQGALESSNSCDWLGIARLGEAEGQEVSTATRMMTGSLQSLSC